MDFVLSDNLTKLVTRGGYKVENAVIEKDLKGNDQAIKGDIKGFKLAVSETSPIVAKLLTELNKKEPDPQDITVWWGLDGRVMYPYPNNFLLSIAQPTS
jgi:hypothetical protein